MAEFVMPSERDFGWALKPTASTQFGIFEKPNGQFCVVLNHALLRGVTSEMLQWWFLNFPNLKVTLDDIPSYEGQSVPGYLLWHPSDHCDATLEGRLGPDNTSRVGAKIHIQEAMQYNTYGLKYSVNAALEIFYCAADGWAMGRSIPVFGKAMCLRIHFKDVVHEGQKVGVHYHYEIVIGVNGSNPVSKALNKRITGEYSPEFFEAWHLHNTIEVGTFENFLPSLYAQRGDASGLRYAKAMDPLNGVSEVQAAHSADLFETRLAGFKSAKNPYSFQGYDARSFL
ncbi:MAG: hypothetical protein AAFX02_00600 [Pseudomonadota bacterium]